jgi:hypothetical protein
VRVDLLFQNKPDLPKLCQVSDLAQMKNDIMLRQPGLWAQVITPVDQILTEYFLPSPFERDQLCNLARYFSVLSNSHPGELLYEVQSKKECFGICIVTKILTPCTEDSV